MLLGCYFHLTQHFVRKIRDLGLKLMVSEIHEVALSLKMIPALAFEKREEIEKLFQAFVEETTNERRPLIAFLVKN